MKVSLVVCCDAMRFDDIITQGSWTYSWPWRMVGGGDIENVWKQNNQFIKSHRRNGPRL